MDQREYCHPPSGMNSFPPYGHPGSSPQHPVKLPPYIHQVYNLHGNQHEPAKMMYNMPSVLPNTANIDPFWVRNDYFDYPYQQNSPMMGFQHLASDQPVAQSPYLSSFSYDDPPQPFPVQHQPETSAVSTPEIGKNLTEAKTKQEMPEEKKEKKSVPIMVGRRRGGRILPTGVIKNQRTEKKHQLNGRSDAWSKYMNEVRRYKEKYNEEDHKHRCLLK